MLLLLSLVVAGAGLFAYYTVESLARPVAALGGLKLPAVATLSGLLFLAGWGLLFMAGPARSGETLRLSREVFWGLGWGIGAASISLWLIAERKGPGSLLGPPAVWARLAAGGLAIGLVVAVATFDFRASPWVRRHRNALLNGAAVLFGVLVSFGVLEGLMRLVFQPPVYRPLWAESPIPGCVFRAIPNYDGINPTVRVRTNSEGLRCDEISPQKTRKRIVTIGDSVTFGISVEQDKTYSAMLQKMLGEERYEVINGGTPGFQLVQVVAYIKNRGLAFQPDVVIYTFNYDDLSDPYVLDNGFLQMDPHGDYGGKWARRDRFRAFPLPRRLVYRSLLLQAVLLRYYAWREGRGVSGDQDLLGDLLRRRWSWFEARLVELRDTVEKGGGRLLFVVFPLGLSTKTCAEIAAMAHRNGIETINLREVLGDAETYVAKYMCEWDSHPNAAANEVMARSMYERMVKVGFVNALTTSPMQGGQ